MANARRTRNRRQQVKEPGDENAPDSQIETFQKWFRRSRDHYEKWRSEARTCFDFRDGRQWEEKDETKLRESGRPIVTFNRTASVVDSVSGLEVANRQEVRFIPRQLGATAVNELLTAAGKWVRDECYAEDEESDAFMDLVTCGVGVTESRIDYDVDPDGKFVLDRLDPLEMFPDSTSRARNFTDMRHCFRVRQVGVEEAKAMFPDKTLTEIDAVWARDMEGDVSNPHNATEAPYYRNDQAPDIEKRDGLVTLVEVQWWQLEKKFRVLDPGSGKIVTLSEEDHSKLKERMDVMGMKFMSVPMKKRAYYRAILGSEVLKTWDGPTEGGFTWKFMTGKRDRNKGYWYGLVRAMIDPQKWANKWLSQVMHIVNSNAKGGLLAESDVFDNPQEAEDSWADPGAITVTTPGAISGGKLQQKEPMQYPQGIDHLMQFAISSIRDVSGVNVELLGMANKDQPGILEHQRKQAGMTILAGMFDSLRQYRKEAGKLMLYFITEFLSDGRLIKIGGDDTAQYVPLIHQKGLVEYDVIVDDTPTSPNMKEQAWAVLVQMMPFLAKVGLPPQAYFEILKYSPLPSAFISDVKNAVMQATQNKPQDPKLIVAQAQAASHQADAQAKIAQIQSDQAIAQTRLQADRAKALGDVAAAHGEVQRAQADSANTNAQAFKAYAQGIQALAQGQALEHSTGFDAVQMLMDAIAKSHGMALDEQGQAHDQALAQQSQAHDQALAQQGQAADQSMAQDQQSHDQSMAEQQAATPPQQGN